MTSIGFVNATIYTDGGDWRIDHSSFSSDTFSVAVFANGANSPQDFPIGLVDHNDFVNTRVVAFGGDLMANQQWHMPYTLGSKDAVYIEDNHFRFTVHGNVVDCNYAGRYVFRHNVVVDAYAEAHSVQGTHRGCRSWEIYSNRFSQVTRAMWTPFFLRGGTGVVFDNTIDGNWSSPAVTFDNVRSFESRGAGGRCDGTSPWDGNQDPTGYPCRDQIGRSDDLSLWTTAQPYPRQKLEPAYIWNNRVGNQVLPVVIHNNSGHHIKAGRDYFTGIPKPGYAAYTYPHPMTTVSTPSNLRVVRP